MRSGQWIKEELYLGKKQDTTNNQENCATYNFIFASKLFNEYNRKLRDFEINMHFFS